MDDLKDFVICDAADILRISENLLHFCYFFSSYAKKHLSLQDTDFYEFFIFACAYLENAAVWLCDLSDDLYALCGEASGYYEKLFLFIRDQYNRDSAPTSET